MAVSAKNETTANNSGGIPYVEALGLTTAEAAFIYRRPRVLRIPRKAAALCLLAILSAGVGSVNKFTNLRPFERISSVFDVVDGGDSSLDTSSETTEQASATLVIDGDNPVIEVGGDNDTELGPGPAAVLTGLQPCYGLGGKTPISDTPHSLDNPEVLADSLGASLSAEDLALVNDAVPLQIALYQESNQMQCVNPDGGRMLSELGEVAKQANQIQ